MTNYLLEKSRVTGQAHGERCFHVLHYLLKGATEQERSDFRLLEGRSVYKRRSKYTVYICGSVWYGVIDALYRMISYDSTDVS